MSLHNLIRPVTSVDTLKSVVMTQDYYPGDEIPDWGIHQGLYMLFTDDAFIEDHLPWNFGAERTRHIPLKFAEIVNGLWATSQDSEFQDRLDNLPDFIYIEANFTEWRPYFQVNDVMTSNTLWDQGT